MTALSPAQPASTRVLLRPVRRSGAARPQGHDRVVPRPARSGDRRRRVPVHGPDGGQRLDQRVHRRAAAGERAATGADEPGAARQLRDRQVGAQVFVLAAIFAVSGLIGARARVRHPGLGRVEARDACIDLARQGSAASAMLAVTAVVVPIVVTGRHRRRLYGLPDLGPVVAITAGAIAFVVFTPALGLAIATVLLGAVPVVAVSFAVFALCPRPRRDRPVDGPT